jgi:hypothetical protein
MLATKCVYTFETYWLSVQFWRVEGYVCVPPDLNSRVFGSFCRKLLEAGVDRLMRPGFYELCVRNADKGAITAAEISTRLRPFHDAGLPIVLTDAARYTDKAALFPGAQFVLGYDTAVRIIMPRYYGDSEAQMVADFAALKAAGCGFVVAGRVHGGKFLGLKDIDIPDVLRHIGVDFSGIAEESFRMDISSTEIRRQTELEMDAKG